MMPDVSLLAGKKEKTLERLHNLNFDFNIHFFAIDDLVLDLLLLLRRKLHDRVHVGWTIEAHLSQG